MERITTIIIHYDRPNNMRQIIEGIRGQSVKSDIIVWDNSNNCPDVGQDITIKSTHNFYAQPRFWLTGMLESEYIFSQDDDFVITNNLLFHDLIELSNQYPDYLIGVKGKVFGEWSDKEKPYQHSTGWKNEGAADMVNTGLCFFQTKLMNNIIFNPFKNGVKEITKEEMKFGDDMYISSFLKCYAYDFEHRGVSRLDEGNKALSKQSTHMEIRNNLCKRYWL